MSTAPITETSSGLGRITQVMGPVVDVVFKKTGAIDGVHSVGIDAAAFEGKRRKRAKRRFGCICQSGWQFRKCMNLMHASSGFRAGWKRTCIDALPHGPVNQRRAENAGKNQRSCDSYRPARTRKHWFPDRPSRWCRYTWMDISPGYDRQRIHRLEPFPR